MKNLALALIFVLILCLAAFAQTNKTSRCPTILVTNQSATILPNEPITFAALVSKKPENFSLKYNWSTSGGEIVEEQGTSIVKVLPKNFARGLSAAIEIKGLPKECPNVGHITMAEPALPPKIQLFTEFSTASLQIDKARLDSLTKKLLNDTTTMVYIIEKFKPNTSQKSIKQKVREITDYLIKDKRIEKDRIVVLTASSAENLSQFFIVPAGAIPPTINDK